MSLLLAGKDVPVKFFLPELLVYDKELGLLTEYPLTL
jgi:hypothetical protein